MKFIKKHQQNLLILLIFVIGVAIFYGNTLQNGFVFDDHQQVEQNIYVHSFSNLPKVIFGCNLQSTNCSTSYFYRPLQILSYMFIYQISSQPWIFHLANLAYFTVTIFLIFIFVKLLTKNFLVSFLSAFIFLIHPINTQVVNWVATSTELLYTIFILLAVIFYFLYRSKRKSQYLIFTYIFYALGILSKEPAALAPLIFLTLDLTYFKKKISWFFKWKNIKPYVIYTAIFIVYMGLRLWVLGGLGIGSYNKLILVQRIYAFFYLFASYIEKLFWPNPLTLHYEFSLPPFLSISFIMVIFIIIGFMGLCLVSWKKKWTAVFVGLIWFVVFLLENLIFIDSIVDSVFSERFVFASAIGFSIIIALLLENLWKKNKKWKIAFAVFLSTISLISLIAVNQRNMVWRNDVNLYVDTLKKNPDADGIRYNLAAIYQNQGYTALAKDQYIKIIKRGTWENIFIIDNILGKIYYNEGNYQEALYYFEKNLKENPPNGNHHNIKVLCSELRRESANYIKIIYVQQEKLLEVL